MIAGGRRYPPPMTRTASPPLILTLALLATGCEREAADPPGLATAGEAESVSGPLAVGDAVPDLPFPDLPGADAAPLSLHDLRGETVLIEFWATWCGPCREAIPHLNALAVEFEGEPVRFLAVSLDDPATVAEFLKTTRFDARVGADQNAAWHDAFGVATVPTAVLIGPDGRLAAVARPGEADAALIDRVAAGRIAGDGSPLPQADPADPDPLLKVVVVPAAGGGEPSWSGAYRGELRGKTAAELVAFALGYGESPDGCSLRAPLPEGRFDLSYRFPPTLDEMTREIGLRAAVLAAFDAEFVGDAEAE